MNGISRERDCLFLIQSTFSLHYCRSMPLSVTFSFFHRSSCHPPLTHLPFAFHPPSFLTGTCTQSIPPSRRKRRLAITSKTYPSSPTCSYVTCVGDEIAAKAEILPSPADTDDTILQFGEQCIRDVCAAEAVMNTPFARVTCACKML